MPRSCNYFHLYLILLWHWKLQVVKLAIVIVDCFLLSYIQFSGSDWWYSRFLARRRRSTLMTTYELSLAENRRHLVAILWQDNVVWRPCLSPVDLFTSGSWRHRVIMYCCEYCFWSLYCLKVLSGTKMHSLHVCYTNLWNNFVPPPDSPTPPPLWNYSSLELRKELFGYCS